MPLFGVRFPRDGMWLWLHRTTTNVAVFLIGVHVALHWSWIVKTIKKYVVSPIAMRLAGKRTLNQPVAALKLMANKEG